ncbi:MAG: hypothetical protein K6T83_09315 [Alicyclobacillus sp.]|nr:hypothetical protein [Alicyclobacillus sp.]
MSDKRVVEEHEQTERFEEHVVTPKHDDRDHESELFRRNKHLLVHEMNLPCFKCAMKAWPDKPPPEAYEGREVHHYIVEWSKEKAVDLQKLQHLFDSGFFDPYGFSAKMRGQSVESVDDIRNLVILCSRHHRGKGIGIHNSTAPEWLSDLVAKDGVDILLTDEEWRLLASGQAELGDDGKLIMKEAQAHHA